MKKLLCFLAVICCISFTLVGCVWSEDKGRLELDVSGVQTVLHYDEDLDLSNLKVLAIKDGESIILENDIDGYTISYGDFNKKVAGTYVITISYGEYKVATFEVVVEPEIKDIELEGNYRTKYILNERLDFKDAKLKINYVDGTSANLDLLNDDVIIGNYSFASSGNKSISIRYLNKVCQISVYVYNVTVQDYEIVQPNKTQYNYGEELDLTGGKLNLSYGEIPSSLPEDIIVNELSLSASNVSITGFDSTIFGNCTLTINYCDIVKTFDVQIIAPTITSVSLIKPAKVSYRLDEQLSLEGGYLVVNYSYLINDELTPTQVYLSNSDVTISGFDSSSEGTYTITITYKGNTLTYDVSVYEPELNEIKLLNFKTEYNLNEDIDVLYSSIELYYTYGEPTKLDLVEDYGSQGVTITNFDTSTAGEKVVTVSYGGLSVNYTIKVYNVDENAFILQFLVNNEQIDLLNTDYVEFEVGVDEINLDLTLNSKYSLVLEGGYTTFDETKNQYTRIVDLKSNGYKGTNIRLFIYDKQKLENDEDDSLVYSKNLGIYKKSYINSLSLNGVEFVRAGNDLYKTRRGNLVTPKKNVNFDVSLANGYTYTTQKVGGVQGYSKETKYILNVINGSTLVQSFNVEFNCDETLFDEVYSNVKINNQFLRSGVIYLSDTTSITVNKGSLTQYTLNMYVDGSLVSPTSGKYTVKTGANKFTMVLTNSSATLVFDLIIFVGDSDDFGISYISELRLVDVVADYDYLRDSFIIVKPNGFNVNVNDFTVVFENAYSDYSFNIALSGNNGKLRIYNGQNTLVHTSNIEIYNFDNASNKYLFYAVYLKKGEQDDNMIATFIDFDNQNEVTISNCLEGTPIQITMINDYMKFTVSSNCIGLADKEGKNFTAFLIDSGNGQNYININVTAQNGVQKLFKLIVNIHTEPYVTFNIGNNEYKFYGSTIINGLGDFNLVKDGNDKYYKLVVPKGTVNISVTKETKLSVLSNTKLGYYVSIGNNNNLFSKNENLTITLDSNNSITLFVGECKDITKSEEITNFYNNAIKLVIEYEM